VGEDGGGDKTAIDLSVFLSDSRVRKEAKFKFLGPKPKVFYSKFYPKAVNYCMDKKM
jgi:hypothetical protein